MYVKQLDVAAAMIQELSELFFGASQLSLNCKALILINFNINIKNF
jgi:hypothetical protein